MMHILSRKIIREHLATPGLNHLYPGASRELADRVVKALSIIRLVPFFDRVTNLIEKENTTEFI